MTAIAKCEMCKRDIEDLSELNIVESNRQDKGIFFSGWSHGVCPECDIKIHAAVKALIRATDTNTGRF